MSEILKNLLYEFMFEKKYLYLEKIDYEYYLTHKVIYWGIEMIAYWTWLHTQIQILFLKSSSAFSQSYVVTITTWTETRSISGANGNEKITFPSIHTRVLLKCVIWCLAMTASRFFSFTLKYTRNDRIYLQKPLGSIHIVSHCTLFVTYLLT